MQNEVVQLKQEKKCPCCGKVKHRSEFSACKNTSSGLAPYCKLCAAAKSRELYKIKKFKKSKNLGSMLSHKANKLGVKYSYEILFKQHGKYRDRIIYNCPNCGEVVHQSRRRALDTNFLCHECLTKNIIKKRVSNSHEITKNNINKQENQEVGFVKFKSPNEKVLGGKIFLIPIPQYIEKPVEEKKGLFNWVKKLFHR